MKEYLNLYKTMYILIGAFSFWSASCESSKNRDDKIDGEMRIVKLKSQSTILKNIFEYEDVQEESVLVESNGLNFKTSILGEYFNDSTNVYIAVYDNFKKNEFLLLNKQFKAIGEKSISNWEYLAYLIQVLKDDPSTIDKDIGVYALEDRRGETIFVHYTQKDKNDDIYTLTCFAFRDEVKYELTLKSRDISELKLSNFKKIYTTVKNGNQSVFTPYSSDSQYVMRITE